ncbi:MAG: PD-(D/E)XK nuclease family protein [Candidatus Moranbacteria bacterium]|nr:PD-(D/E)XK nuclease family protein [Candidatus Moranbacteria bacterium]
MQTSYSALNSFQTCPLKYKFEAIDKIKSKRKSPEAQFGTLIHSVMKFIHSGNFLLPTQKEALEYFTKNWIADVFKDEFQERSAFAQGVRIIQDYYKKNDPNKIKIVDLESRFTVDLPQEGDKHIISGIIDRIDKTANGFEIIDYKTSNKLPSQATVDDDLQLLIYLMAFLKRYPKLSNQPEKVNLSLYYLKHGTKLTTQKTKQQLEEEKIRIFDLLEEIQNSDFQPKVTALCDWCDFQEICPMWKHKFKEEKKTPTEQEKQQIIEQYLILQDKIKAEKKQIQELQQQILDIMEQEKADRLFSEDKIIAKKPYKTYEYDEETVKNVLEEAGLWQEVLKLDKTKLKKVAASLPPNLKRTVENAKYISKESFGLSVKEDKKK